jgi:hypothetical protein
MVPTLRHVLVIGVDGVRFDLLGPEVTPVIWDFRFSGFLGPVPVDEATPTWSGPCWAIFPDAGELSRYLEGGHRLCTRYRHRDLT